MRVVITFAHVNIIVSWLVSHNVETAASVHLRRKPIPEAPDAIVSGPRLDRAAEATGSADRCQHCPPTIVRAARALRVACNPACDELTSAAEVSSWT